MRLLVLSFLFAILCGVAAVAFFGQWAAQESERAKHARGEPAVVDGATPSAADTAAQSDELAAAPSAPTPAEAPAFSAPGAPADPSAPASDAATVAAEGGLVEPLSRGIAPPAGLSGSAPSQETVAALDNTADALAEAAAALPTLTPPSAGDAVDDATAALQPVFDLVRVEPSGAAVLAGRAEPNALVTVMVDGAEQTQVRADRRGEFVALLDPPTTRPEGMTLGLRSVGSDGAVYEAAAPVIIALPADPGAAPVALRPTAEGPELMQPAAPRPDGGVSIDTVSYDADGAVVVAGRGDPGQVARVYLDGGLEAEIGVDEEGDWRADLGRDIAPEVYALRVDQIAPSGDVTSRAETPFERAPIEDVVLQGDGVVVQPGNNLWRIATYVYGDGLKYHVIFSENSDQIRDPDLIFPGQVFALPATATTD